VAGKRGQNSLQEVLVLCRGSSPALTDLEFFCQACRAKVWVQTFILCIALPHLPWHAVWVGRLLQRWGHYTVKPLHAWQIHFAVTSSPILP